MEIGTAQEYSPPVQSQEKLALPSPQKGGGSDELNAEQRRMLIFITIAILVLLVATIVSVYFLASAPTSEVARIRDIFIIFMAVQSLFMGLALVILLIQLARLINLLQNEIKPILDSTNQTVSTLRGTTAFLSDNLVEPVIKMNEYMAGLAQLLQVLGLMKRSPKKRSSKGE